MSPDRILLYCRPGFEGECSQEILDLAAESGLAGYIKTQRGGAYVEFIESMPGAARKLFETQPFERLIFARQWLLCLPMLSGLGERDRVAPILQAFQALDVPRLGNLWVEAPDTEEGKTLATFCRKFTSPLAQALKRDGLLTREQNPKLPWGHAFFLDSGRVYVGFSRSGNRSDHQNGILRLKFPAEAPSRSTLKLDEAWHTFLPHWTLEDTIKAGTKAVDLGAAPGGWTWQLVRRGLFVTAVDNGPMDPALMETGQVTHRREDGFKFVPKPAVDWMVCDMVEKPHRVAERMAEWLVQGWCRQTIFNLKLPMKRRYEEVVSCLQMIRARVEAQGLQLEMRARQLYHDREEVTVFARVIAPR